MPDYRAIARQKAQKYGLDPNIFQRQINAESGFNPGSGSSAGAIGIAQIMPGTAAAWGVNPRDPVASLDAAARHMAQYVRKYGSYEKALRAYNAGEGAIEKSRGYGETNAYVAKILVGGRDPGKIGTPRSGGGGLSRTLTGSKPRTVSQRVTGTGVSGGQPVELPDVGDASGLSQLLLSGVGQPRQQVPVGQVGIQAPSFSSERYGSGSVQPVGLGATSQGSGIADQLAALASARDVSLPPVQNTASSASASGVARVTPSAAASPATGVTSARTARGGAESALKWARSTIGVAETGGANRGPRIDRWEQRFGLQGQPWCAMFTSLAATKGGMAGSGRTASVDQVRKQATRGSAAYQKGFVDPRNAKPGDLILFGVDHIGMVESNTGRGLVMIAGNDSNRVQRRTVAYGSGDIVRPKYGR